MAQDDDALLQDEDKRKRQFGQDPSRTRDPLFYEGKTPVLGQDVAVQEPTGELTFPEAGPSAVGPAGPGAPPTPNPYPPFPEFDLQMPEFNFAFNRPQPELLNEFGPGMADVPWWSKALSTAQRAEQLGKAAYNLYDLTKATPYPDPSLVGSEAVGGQAAAAPYNPEALFPQGSPTSPVFPTEAQVFDPSAMAATEGITTPGIAEAGLPGGGFPEPSTIGSEAVGPQVDIGGGIEGTGPMTGVGTYVGPALNALGLGMGAYTAATAEPGSKEQLAAIPQLAGAGAGLAADLGLIGSQWAALGPAGLALAAPLISGMIYENFFRGDRARFPEGYARIPGGPQGAGALAVDPATGKVVEYTGDGKYRWTDETLAGRPMSPELFKQFQIEPTGRLATHPDYATIGTTLRNEDIARAGQPAAAGGQPQYPTEPHQRNYLEEWRQPYLDQLKAQYPMADEGELWRLYTQTPWYQQEMLMLQSWNPDVALANRG